MRISETIQSSWLRVEDLGSNPTADYLDLTIKTACMGSFGDGKPSLDLEFHEHEKRFGCQPTNRKRLVMIFGDEMHLEALPGNRIRLLCEMTTDMKGNPCWGVRIVAVPNTMQAESQAARQSIQRSMAAQGVQPRDPRIVPNQRMVSNTPNTIPQQQHQAPQGDPVYDQSPDEPAGMADDYDQSQGGM